MKVTALKTGKGRNKRIKVFLDGRFAFAVTGGHVTTEDLQLGQELSATQVEGLSRSDQFERGLETAKRYLDYRPRSESELRERLHRRGYDADSIDKIIERLRESGLLDDLAFARFWKDNRESFRPRSRRLTALELRQKGVARGVIQQVVGDIDEKDNAYRAALDKARRLPLTDYADFYRRLGDYLRRRGFDYEVINSTVKQIWNERSDSSTPEAPIE